MQVINKHCLDQTIIGGEQEISVIYSGWSFDGFVLKVDKANDSMSIGTSSLCPSTDNARPLYAQSSLRFDIKS